MDVNTIYHRSVEFFADRVNAVRPEQWDDPTPCVGWSVRDLAGHVTYENLWTIPLMEGATIEEVGDRFEGDVLGADPIGSALAAARAAITSVATQLPLGGNAQLSFGPTPKDEYAMQLAADNLIHGWDLAVATGGDTRIDPHLVHGVAAWFGDREEMYRTGGAIAARGQLTGDPQHDLLAASAGTRRGAATTRRWCSSTPRSAAVTSRRRSAWSPTTSSSTPRLRRPRAPTRGPRCGAGRLDRGDDHPGMSFEEEESFVSGDRAVVAGPTAGPARTRGTSVAST